MPEEKKAAYLKYYNEVMLTGLGGIEILKPEKDFDENGLRFPIEYLNKMSQNIIMFPLEIMAEYVDVRTKNYVDTKDDSFIFHAVIDSDLNIEETYDSINATAIGNMAYIAMFSHDEKARSITEDWLNKIFVKAKGKLLNIINEHL